MSTVRKMWKTVVAMILFASLCRLFVILQSFNCRTGLPGAT